MTDDANPHPDRRQVLAAAAALGLVASLPGRLSAQAFPAFAQAVAEGVAADEGLSAFYRETGYAPVWTGPDHAVRRAALVTALARAGEHGIPPSRYAIDDLIAAYHRVGSERERGLLEARTSLTLVRYARDIGSGLLEPGRIIEQIVRTLPRPDSAALMRGLVRAEPVAFLRSLAPRSPEYVRLHRAKFELEQVIARGGWGPRVPAGSLRPGDSGPQVVALRNRLIEMGWLARVATARYDGAIQRAVQAFQIAHGLEPDGIANQATINALNVAPEERLKPVIVALERERWLNIPRGDRHIWVNLTDFKARIMDFDRVTFETRSVVGGQSPDTQTPEFSHRMTYIEINPDWTIPRSILARSYWSGLVAGGHPHLEIVDHRGRVVPREEINFALYSPRTFPYEVRQPPGPTNPLGRVKFMFPNPWSIYLHDSPARALFQTVVRTHSSGCIRLNDADEFAYELLSRQEADPVGFYQRILRSGQQTRVFLDEPVPIHLEYRTAFTSVDGRLNFRNDVYGRDATLYRALVAAGVESRALQG
jgi:murein L,D-transpeptidase YcbB/YkuD